MSLSSCKTDSNAQVTTIIEKDVSGWSGVTNAKATNITLVQELTVGDSMLLLNEAISRTNQGYNHQLDELAAGVRLLSKSRNHLYFSNGEVNQYYKKEYDNRIADMKETCKEIDIFSDGLDGKYGALWGDAFMAYNSLKDKKKDALLAKVYKATLNYHAPSYYGGRITGTIPKTEVRYFFISPDGTKVLKSKDQFSMPQGPQEQFLDFKRYSVNDEGKITILSADAKLSEEPLSPAEGTIIAKYAGSEFLGYCNVIFKTDGGEEIYFINPNLGAYADENEMCGMKDEFVGKKFKITHNKGEIKVYTEEGNETIETEIIQAIEIIK